MPTVFSSQQKPAKDTAMPSRPVYKEGAPHDHMGPFTSFARNPRRVRFETQEEKEHVVLFLRQHMIVNLTWIALAVVMVFAPTVILPFLVRTLLGQLHVPQGYVIVGTLGWYLGTFGFILASFIDWFFNIYIVTNERIVDIDFFHLLYKHFTQAEIYRIQEISYTTGGIVATFFNYGRVVIQTAGDMPNLEFDRVPNPEKVVSIIREQMGRKGALT